MHGHEAPNSPSQVFSSLLLSRLHSHTGRSFRNRRRCGGVRGAKRGQSGGREGAEREVTERMPSLPQPEQRGSPSKYQPTLLQPLGCQTRGLEPGSIRRASSIGFSTPIQAQCLEMTGGEAFAH